MIYDLQTSLYDKAPEGQEKGKNTSKAFSPLTEEIPLVFEGQSSH